MKTHTYILITFVVILSTIFFFVPDAFAQQAEDKIIGIMERVLGVIADFIGRIIDMIVDGIKDIFSSRDDA